MSREAVVIDIGGLLKRRNRHTGGLWFSDDYLHAPPMPGATRWFPELVQNIRNTNRRPVILSRSRTPQETDKKIRWFKHHGFCASTGLKISNFIFCERREHKVEIARSLSAVAALDNKPEVLIPMCGVVELLCLFQPTEEELKIAKPHLHHFQIKQTWYNMHRAVSAHLRRLAA